MLYECLPLSWLITQAGGKAISNRNDILDIYPKHIHDRIGITVGSKNDVEEILQFNKKFAMTESETERLDD